VPGPSLTPEAPPPAPAVNAATSLRQLHRWPRALCRHRFVHRPPAPPQQVTGKDGPEEVLLFKFRKEPWSIYFNGSGRKGQGGK